MSNYRTVGSGLDVEQLAEAFQALSNPKRLEIFLRLIAVCPPDTACDDESVMSAWAGELGEGLGIAKSTMSHHLKELRRAGLLQMERRGRRMACSVAPIMVCELADFFSAAAGGKSPCGDPEMSEVAR